MTREPASRNTTDTRSLDNQPRSAERRTSLSPAVSLTLVLTALSALGAVGLSRVQGKVRIDVAELEAIQKEDYAGYKTFEDYLRKHPLLQEAHAAFAGHAQSISGDSAPKDLDAHMARLLEMERAYQRAKDHFQKGTAGPAEK